MQHHLFYRLLIISCTFFLISCQQTIECYLIPSTEKASDFYKVQPRNSGTLFLAKNEAEHIQIVFKGCPGETYKYIETKMPTILSDIVVGKSNRYMDSTMP